MQTILVCDDDKEIVEAIDIYLQQEGYQVLKAYDGEEALEILKEKRSPSSDHRRHDAAAGRHPGNVKDPGGEQYPDHYSICENGRCGQDFRT